MADIKRLETELREAPDNAVVAAGLHQELKAALGFSEEEARAHVDYIRVMARRAATLARAAEVMRHGTPMRGMMVEEILISVNLVGITDAAFHIVNNGDAPEVEDHPRVVAGRERTIVIRVPAAWLIAKHNAYVEHLTQLVRRPRRDE